MLYNLAINLRSWLDAKTTVYRQNHVWLQYSAKYLQQIDEIRK